MLWRNIATTVFVVLIVVTAYFTFPGIRTGPLAPQFLLIIGLSTGGMQLAAALFFITSLRTFKTRLQLAYSALAFGITCLALAQLQLTLLPTLHLEHSPWISTGTILIPYAISGIAIYVGMRIFARILDIHSFFASTWKTLLAVAALITVFTLLPHLRPTANAGAEVALHIYVGLVLWTGFFMVASLDITRRIKGVLGELYAPPLNLLGWGLGFLALAGFHEALLTSHAPDQTFYATSGLSLLPLLVSGTILMIAGSAFREIAHSRIAATATPLDIVIYTAQLASSPRQIEPIMDTVRQLTARLNNKTGVSANDTAALVGVYTKLENYLVTKEPLRKFSRESLRARLPEGFEQSLRGH